MPIILLGMKRRTKIVATLGPAVDSQEKVCALVEAGVNVVRINCSHGNWETRRQWAKWSREACSDVSPIALLVDLQGPKFRLGDIKGGFLELAVNQTVTLGSSAEALLPIHQAEILAAMGPGGKLLLGDGEVEIRITAQKGADYEGKVQTAGTVKSRQGITLVGKVFDVPSLTEQDRADVKEACAVGVDFIALSYIRSAADMRDLRREVDKYDPSIKLCAKIETRDGLKNIDEILKVADIVMVARGDMGLQMELEDVPLAQKRIISRCSEAAKPVITATQMLESMMHSPRPTRAETTDVANAILDGTDAVMLSGETAAGEFPVEAVQTMVRIALEAERSFPPRERRRSRVESDSHAISHAACYIAEAIDVQAIAAFTRTGFSARIVSKDRPRVPIYAFVPDERIARRLALDWAVRPCILDFAKSTDELVASVDEELVRMQAARRGEAVVLVGGTPLGVQGRTNFLKIMRVGESAGQRIV